MPLTEFGFGEQEISLYNRGRYIQAPSEINAWEITNSVPASGANFTWNHTTVARNGNILFLFIACNRSGGVAIADPTTMTFNGAAMTKLDSVTVGTTSSAYAGIYYTINPPIGTLALHAIFGANVHPNFLSVNFSGVHQTTPVMYSQKATGAAALLRGFISPARPIEAMIDCLATFTAGAHIPAGGQTKLFDFDSDIGAMSIRHPYPFGVNAMEWTFPTSSVSAYMMACLNPA